MHLHPPQSVVSHHLVETPQLSILFPQNIAFISQKKNFHGNNYWSLNTWRYGGSTAEQSLLELISRLCTFNHCRSSPCVVRARLVKWLILYQSHLQIITSDFINPGDPGRSQSSSFFLPAETWSTSIHHSVLTRSPNGTRGEQRVVLIASQCLELTTMESDIMFSFGILRLKKWLRGNWTYTSSDKFPLFLYSLELQWSTGCKP